MDLAAIFTFRIIGRRRTRVSCAKGAAILYVLLTALVFPAASKADGLSAVKSCESDYNPPEETVRLTILPNGESRGSDTAAALIRMARQKAKEGKDDEAIRWAVLCQFEAKEQDEIRRDSAAVLQYLKN
jgi:hypothetical protein